MCMRPKLVGILVAAMLCMGGIAVHASVKLSGIISNKTSDSVSISFSSNRLAYYPQEFTAVTTAAGAFTIEFPFPEGVYIQAELKHGVHLSELMLHDGDSLVLLADDARFDSSLHYTGRGAAVQNFVVQHVLLRGRVNQYMMRLRNNVGLTPDAFITALDKERKEEFSFADKHKAGLTENFLFFWKAHFTYYNYFFLQQYPQMHEIMLKNRYTDTIPDANYAVLKAMPAAYDDKLITVPPYLLYLTGVFESRLRAAGYAQPLYENDNATRFLDSVHKLAYLQLPPRSAEYYIAQSLYARARNQPITRTQDQYAAFRKKWPASEYTEMLDKQTQLAARLAPGQPAPDLDITTPDGTHKKLSELKGNVVYISFWSARVKQTVGEMRADRKIREVFKNKPVSFVYVCIDEDAAAAQSVLHQLKLEGNYVWTAGGWYAPEAIAYGVQGLPAHYLIDTMGNFAMQNPPGPMQKTELIVAISKLY
jgi:hypothetical protein